MTGYFSLSFAFSEACVGSKIDNAAAFARGAVRTKRLAADKNFMPMIVVVRENGHRWWISQVCAVK